MGVREEAVRLLRKGHSPTQIAKSRGVTLSTIMGYLRQKVGEGVVRWSDIALSFDEKTRHTIEGLIAELGTTNWYDIWKAAQAEGTPIDRDDVQAYLEARRPEFALGSMYEIIRDIEVTLHERIKRILVSAYAQGDWWREGVPENVRVKCQKRRETDPGEPADHPYSYTDLLDLKDILVSKQNWSSVFCPCLPAQVTSNKRELEKRLSELSPIRNSVMHPVRGQVPDDRDFLFAQELRDYLQLHSWPSVDDP